MSTTGVRPPARGISSATPASRWEDAFVAGNGHHGVLLYGRPHDECAVVTHHSLVLPNAGTSRLPPVLGPRLAKARALALAGDSAGALREACDGWDEWLPQSFHPAFALRLKLAGASAGEGAYLRTLDFTTGVLGVSWDGPGGQWSSTCFVSRVRDAVVLRLAPPPGVTADLALTHDVRLDGAPAGLTVATLVPTSVEGGTVTGVTVLYPPVDGGPPGSAGGYTGLTRITAPGGEVVPDGGTIRVRGTGDIVLVTQVTRFPAGRATGTARAGARHLAGLPAVHRVLLAEHSASHKAVFGDVRLDLGAPASDRELPVEDLLARQATDPGRPGPALLEKLFDSGRYLLLSASGLLPPRLPGLWQGDWTAAWAGDITTNANVNLALAGAVTTGVPAAIHALAAMIGAQLADWRFNAARLYGARGVMAPAHTDGTNGLACHFAPAFPHQLWLAGADWLLVPLLEHVAATGDEAFLRDHVMPPLTELALFYEDILGAGDPGAGGDGEGAPPVVFAPSYSPENQPRGWTGAAVNATMDIAAARHALASAIAVAGRLGAHCGGAPARWRALLARLPSYRVNSDGALAEWAGLPDGPPLPDNYEHRHVSHLYPVWPLHEITVDGTPALAAAARQALRLRSAQDGSAHGYLHCALAAARLRDPALAGTKLAALTGGGYFFRSLMSGHYQGPAVYNADAACCLPGLVAEMLADSADGGGGPGWVELLPATPDWLPPGRVTGIRAASQVRLDLVWDFGAGQATAVLASDITQEIDLICRRAEPEVRRRLRLESGVPATVTLAGIR